MTEKEIDTFIDDFEEMNWTKEDEISYGIKEITPEIKEALSFVPFFQNEGNITKENIAFFICKWNEINPDHSVDPSDDLPAAILSIKSSMVQMGADAFINGVGLYALFSKKLKTLLFKFCILSLEMRTMIRQ